MTEERGATPLKERVWARYNGICWACGLTVRTKHGRVVPVADEPRVDKMREDNLVPMHQDCALLKPKTPTWKKANYWRSRTRGAAGAREKATLHVLRDVLEHGCDPDYVREALHAAEAAQAAWWDACGAADDEEV
jgi:hypothetical protein